MKKIRLLSWNVNGLRAAYKKGFLDWFNSEQPDIMCLQETKAMKEQLPSELQDVEGYHTHYSSAEKKGYSGVAVYSKEKPLDVKTGIGIEKFDSEGRFLILEYKNFVLFNIYYPNGKARAERLKYKMEFYEAFLDYANALKRKNIVVCGDVNTAHKEIDLARPKQNQKTSGFLPEEREWIDSFLNAGYLDTFRMFNDQSENYTWWDMVTRARDRNVGWRIDYFFISEGLKKNIETAFIMKDVMGSDHCPVGIELKF
jgi:exodeoxyribonuclease-3